jgi:hypothetical protein
MSVLLSLVCEPLHGSTVRDAGLLTRMPVSVALVVKYTARRPLALLPKLVDTVTAHVPAGSVMLPSVVGVLVGTVTALGALVSTVPTSAHSVS